MGVNVNRRVAVMLIPFVVLLHHPFKLLQMARAISEEKEPPTLEKRHLQKGQELTHRHNLYSRIDDDEQDDVKRRFVRALGKSSSSKKPSPPSDEFGTIGTGMLGEYIKMIRDAMINAKKNGSTLSSDDGKPGLFPTELIFLLLFTILNGATLKDFDLTDRDRCPSDETDRKHGLDLLLINFSGHRKFFMGQSILTGEKGVRAETPGLCTTIFISHEAIKEGQSKLPILQTAGDVVRRNELGLFRLNFRTFEYCLDMLPEEEHDFCRMALGMPNNDHEQIRPRFDAIWGDGNKPGTIFSTVGSKWTKQSFLDSAIEFLQDKTEVNLPADATFWIIKELHKQALGLDLSDTEVQSFVSLQSATLLLSILPFPVVDVVAAQLGTSVDDINKGKTFFVSLYKTILPSIFPDLLASDSVELTKMAMALLDGFIFAAGASVPPTIKNGLAAFFTKLTPQDNFSMNNPTDLGVLVLETVRSYPPILGVPYIDVETGQRYAPLAGMAGYDRSVYGDDAEQFRIRGDLHYYHERSLNWADAALPVDGVPESNHVCPGRSMSYSMVVAFWEALDATKWCVDPDTPIVKETSPTFWSDFNIIKGACLDK